MAYVRQKLRKILIGVLGGCVVLLGIIMIPYPGPGWLVVFFGLTILATEFMWAQGILDSLRKKYDIWQVWIRRQPMYLQLLFLVLTGLMIVVTMWLLNGFGIINSVLDLGQDWLVSPFIQIDPTP